MSEENHGMSSAMGNNVNASSGIGNNGRGGGGLMPLGDKGIDISLGSVDSVFKFGSIDSDMFGSLNAGGGAMGGDPASVFSASFDQLLTKQMDESAVHDITNMSFKEVGQLNPIADLNAASTLSARGSAQSQGG